MSAPPPPPQLVFDDGSRVQQETAPESVHDVSVSSPRPAATSIVDYYEIDRLVSEVQGLSAEDNMDGWSCRVALQFPDELLVDAAEVVWAFQDRLPNALFFVIADNMQPCCPDAIAAEHLQANVLIHYGHACFSSNDNEDLTILYSLGQTELDIDACVSAVVEQVRAEADAVRELLVLYQVGYHHAMEEVAASLRRQGLQVVLGQIPSSLIKRSKASSPRGTSATTGGCGRSKCCTSSANEEEPSVKVPLSEKEESSATDTTTRTTTDTAKDATDDSICVVGGLELPSNTDWSTFTLLYIGDDTCRPYLNIILYLISQSTSPRHYWTYHNNQLSTELSPTFSRLLSRRFYLVQKVRAHANVFCLVISSTNDTTRSVVTSLRNLLQRHDKTVYMLCVGKTITIAKLANFPEVDCFCLIACPEHALSQDMEYPTPVLTPHELILALGDVEWGSLPYSLEPNDYLATAAAVLRNETKTATVDDDDDAPYFNLATGRYESRGERNDVDLQQLPGQGQVTAYRSAASDFLRQREYQGLVSTTTPAAQAAVPGQVGIASGYRNVDANDNQKQI